MARKRPLAPQHFDPGESVSGLKSAQKSEWVWPGPLALSYSPPPWRDVSSDPIAMLDSSKCVKATVHQFTGAAKDAVRGADTL